MAYNVINGKLVKVKANSAKKDYESSAVPQSEDSLRHRPRVKPADAGHYGGTCFYSACLRPASATWYNRGSHAFYCRGCAAMLSHANRHDSYCKNDDGTPFPLCYEVTTVEEANELHVSP
jgi:hypothetical protein